MVRSRLGVLVVGGLLAAFSGSAEAHGDNVEQERTLSETLQDKRLQEAKDRGDFSRRDATPETDAAKKAKDEQKQQESGGKKGGRFAILPEVGFSPEKGGKIGVKLTDRDIFGMMLDLSASGAQRGQTKGKVQLTAPDLLNGWLILSAYGLFETDPSKRFFGLGNSDVPDDEELSRHRYQHQTLRLLAAVRLSHRFTVALSGGYNLVDIGHGSKPKGLDDKPVTGHVFEDMAGVRGGKTNPLAFSLVFDDRDEVTRPTRGWNVIAKVERVDEALENDFEYTRTTFEMSYLYPLLTRRQVLGVRVGGEYIDSDRRQTPFYELSGLGGGDDMRGYFPDRFLGRAKVIFGAEYRLKIFDFNFWDIWDVKIDGVGFADGGRVFMKENDIEAELGADPTFVQETKDEMRASYGGGVRFALGEATIARVDVGFSDEEQGLVYLVFGHTF